MALRLHRVTHHYGQQAALEDVSIHVREGECYGFLGHNGAGKTTAMRIALGLLRPRSGTVLVSGFDAARHPLEARARLGGLIERPGFHDHLDGTTNLRLLGRLQGLSASAARSESARVLESVGLRDVASKPVGAYSQGMRQRLGIAQALLGAPPIVLLDEPTNGLDPEGIEEIRVLLRRLTREDGVTVLVSSHRLHEIEGVADRVGILRQGRLLVEAPTGELLRGGVHELDASDPVVARRVLDGLGCTTTERGDRLHVDLGEVSPDGALSALVVAEAGPRTFAPRRRSLEDVYLELTRNGGEATAVDSPPTPIAPTARRAPRAPILRMARYDLGRIVRSRGAIAALALPALVAAAAVVSRWSSAAAAAAEVEGGAVATTTTVTAFEGVAYGLRAGLPVLALVLAALASQSLAGEDARGTLRNVLLRPVSRTQVAVGKAVALLVSAVMSHALLAAVTLGAAALLFDFTDVSEVLFNGELFPLVAAEELHAPLRQALARTLPAVLGCGAVGLMVGALVRGPAAALGVSALGLILLDGARAMLQGTALEGRLPVDHLPTPLRDTSVVRSFLDLAQGISNPTEAAAGFLEVPLIWIVVATVISCIALARRSIR